MVVAGRPSRALARGYFVTNSNTQLNSTPEMRKMGAGRGIITAYPRQLESLIRLSEAHARMRLSNTVEEIDVNEANRLYKEALKQAATDPKTGQIDMEILMTGLSATSRAKSAELGKLILQNLQGKKSMKMGELYDTCRSAHKDGFTQVMTTLKLQCNVAGRLSRISIFLPRSDLGIEDTSHSGRRATFARAGKGLLRYQVLTLIEPHKIIYFQTQYEMAVRDLLEEGKVIQTSNRHIRLKELSA
eukprot:sb/3468904/